MKPSTVGFGHLSADQFNRHRAAFLQRATRVGYRLFGKCAVDQRDGSMRRLSAGLDHGAGAGGVGQSRFCGVTLALDRETRGLEVRTGLGRRR